MLNTGWGTETRIRIYKIFYHLHIEGVKHKLQISGKSTEKGDEETVLKNDSQKSICELCYSWTCVQQTLETDVVGPSADMSKESV